MAGKKTKDARFLSLGTRITPKGDVSPQRGWKSIVKIVPWLSLVIAIGAFSVSFNQFQLQKRSADRVWKAQLTTSLFDTEKCEDAGKRVGHRCPPKASLQSRGLALRDYLQLEREYNRKIEFLDIDLSYVNIEKEDLSDIRIVGSALQSTNMNKCNLLRSAFFETHLDGAHLERAHLEGSQLTFCSLQGAHLAGAFLHRAIFKSTDLGYCGSQQFDNSTGENYIETDLSGVDLSGAVLFRVNFCGTTIGSANIRGADLSEAINLTQQQLESAIGDYTTKIPWTLQRPRGWKQKP